MTGFGRAHCENEQLRVVAEVRTVNNRYLKVAIRCPDAYASLESQVEKLIRESIARGTVTVTIQASRSRGIQASTIDSEVVRGYWNQLKEVSDSLNVTTPNDASSLLALPGAIAEESSQDVDFDTEWPVVENAVQQALATLQSFRTEEGRAAQIDLKQNCDVIANQLDRVVELAPQVVSDYRDKLRDRVTELLQGHDATVDDTDLIREVSIFAEKCDINEEISRLRCHLEQFEVFLNEETSQGRKLEFLSQEIFREVNTIGSKANNVEIAHCVVEMKGAVEKIRENLQNVE